MTSALIRRSGFVVPTLVGIYEPPARPEPTKVVSMQSKTPLTLPSPPRGEEIPLFAPRLLRQPNDASFSRGGALPLPLGERIEVRGVVRRSCIVTALVGICSATATRGRLK